MDYDKDNIAKDKAKAWKSFNKLTVYTIFFIIIILIFIFYLLNQPTISSELKKKLISIWAFSAESEP